MKRHKVAPGVREQIVSRIKEGSVTVQQAAKEHGSSALPVPRCTTKRSASSGTGRSSNESKKCCGSISYGSPRIALVLKRNKKPVERVMKLSGIKAYRRRGRK